ncbi:nitrile hydratase accessory protein [Roseinatronobacter sp.]|uniref:nitrile hydratase accessory protein n=1 Tax=Roseinatronobacter sp. TaxID=1945755 RepID=UPI0025D0813C|nr:nitrile hydratase accessory protein [Rhodobaca sp.]
MTRPEHPFDAPWQAQAFALTLALHEQGLFTWGEWTAALSDALGADAQDGAMYYQCWVFALERLIDQKTGTTEAQRANLAHAWRRAAQATPHGEPIKLENDPEASLICQ